MHADYWPALQNYHRSKKQNILGFNNVKYTQTWIKTGKSNKWIYKCKNKYFQWYYLDGIIFKLNMLTEWFSNTRLISLINCHKSANGFSIHITLVFAGPTPCVCSKSLFSTFMRVTVNAFLSWNAPHHPYAASLPHLYCRASLSAVALDSYFPTSILMRSALLLHSSRVMVRRSFWDLRCSMRLQRKKNLFHDFMLGL